MSLQFESMIDVQRNYVVDHLYGKNDDGPLNVERTLVSFTFRISFFAMGIGIFL